MNDDADLENHVVYDGFRKVNRLARRPIKTEVLMRLAISVSIWALTWVALRVMFGRVLVGSEALWGGLLGLLIGNLIWAVRGRMLIKN